MISILVRAMTWFFLARAILRRVAASQNAHAKNQPDAQSAITVNCDRAGIGRRVEAKVHIDRHRPRRTNHSGATIVNHTISVGIGNSCRPICDLKPIIGSVGPKRWCLGNRGSG